MFRNRFMSIFLILLTVVFSLTAAAGDTQGRVVAVELPQNIPNAAKDEPLNIKLADCQDVIASSISVGMLTLAASALYKFYSLNNEFNSRFKMIRNGEVRYKNNHQVPAGVMPVLIPAMKRIVGF